jgi:glutamate dehydrogenase
MLKIDLPPIQTDFNPIVFPTYIDPFEDLRAVMDPVLLSNKLVDQVIRTPGRQPSPQPTHVSVGAKNGIAGNGYRVIRSATVGYVAPRFDGKKTQMEEGWYPDENFSLLSYSDNL